MEEREQQENKAIENWSGDERRHGPSADYKGDDRRMSKAANDAYLVGAKPPIGDSDAIEGG